MPKNSDSTDILLVILTKDLLSNTVTLGRRKKSENYSHDDSYGIQRQVCRVGSVNNGLN